MRRNLISLLLGLVLAGGAVLFGPAAVAAGSGDVTCTGGPVTTDVPHNLFVTGVCSLASIVIGNDVIVGPGGGLLSGVGTPHIAHDLVGFGAIVISLFSPDGFQVGHDVILTGTTVAGTNTICGASIGHNLIIQNSPAGDAWDVSRGPCGTPNHVGNDLIVRSNGGAVDVEDNTVGHNLTVTNNTGAGTTVQFNTVGNDARCSGNTSPSYLGNTVGHSNTCK